MKQVLSLAIMAAMLYAFIPSSPSYAAGDGLAKMFGIGFTDINGDGINDNAPDDDGDGVPNSQDENYAPPEDGSGSRFGAASATGDGTGLCDGTGPKGSALRGR